MEEMNYVFGVSTRRHAQYQLKEVAPWCVDHYLKRKDTDCPPLYRWARVTDGRNGNASTPSSEETDEG